MAHATDTRPGDFVWYELYTTNPDAAPSFYQHVINVWSSRPPSGARVAQLSDPQGAGFSLHENPKS